MTSTLARRLVFLAALAACAAGCAESGDACLALGKGCATGGDARVDAPGDAQRDGALDGAADGLPRETAADAPRELPPASDSGVPGWVVFACSRVASQCQGEKEYSSATWDTLLQRFGAFGAEACERYMSCQLRNIDELTQPGNCIISWESFFSCIGREIDARGKPGCNTGCESALQGLFTDCGCVCACGDCPGC
ncbi:MAG: hypothetical protein KC503_34225 [Myxococcales bacterium]|nr:hypothetical protein [Myxococcales bacterium]